MTSNDLYGQFREVLCTSGRERQRDPVMGEFDPMNMILRLRWDIGALASVGPEAIANARLTDWRTLFARYDPAKEYMTFLPDAFPDEISADLLHSLPLIVASPGTMNEPKAYAAYFHEMLHWWQHVGTTSGLLYGLAIPAVCQQNYEHIRAAVRQARPLRKPLYRYSMVRAGSHAADLEMNVNTAVNNWFDVEIGAFLLSSPERAAKLQAKPAVLFFDCLGHSIEMLLTYTVGNLAACLDDRRRPVLPDTRGWDAGFNSLRDKGEPGFQHGEPLRLPPFGMQKIQEGQAHLLELQYLHLVSDGRLSWRDFHKDGLLGDEYMQALVYFCEATGLEFPSRPTGGEANLFLILCDISLNPSAGYPDEMVNYRGLLFEISPGIRFLQGCEILGHQHDLCRRLCGEVRPLDGGAYDKVSQAICSVMGVKTPRETARTIVELAARMPSVAALKKDFTGSCKFEPNSAGSMPIRYTFLKHLLLMEDKSMHPEIFCWPAWHFALLGRKSRESFDSAKMLLRRHAPPFVSYGMKSPVRYTPQDGADPAGLERVVAAYFKWMVIYDLYTQLIARDGKFCFNYAWLDSTKDQEWYRGWAAKNFSDLIGCDIGAIETW